MANLAINMMDTELYEFAYKAHVSRFPAMAWKAVACDMMGLPAGTRPTVHQVRTQPHAWTTLWAELTMRFDNMNTVRWAEHLECEEERIHNALVYLGPTVGQIKDRLLLSGVAGKPNDAFCCVFTKYLTGIVGAWFARVTPETSRVDFISCSNPKSVQNTIKMIDAGCVPELNVFANAASIV